MNARFGLGIITMGLACVMGAMATQFPTPPGSLLGPGFFPLVLSPVWFLIGLIMAIQARPGSGAPETAPPAACTPNTTGTLGTTILLAGSAVLFCVNLNVFGFTLSMIVSGIIATFLVAGNWVPVLWVPIATSLAIGFIFVRLLNVVVPEGVLGW